MVDEYRQMLREWANDERVRRIFEDAEFMRKIVEAQAKEVRRRFEGASRSTSTCWRAP